MTKVSKHQIGDKVSYRGVSGTLMAFQENKSGDYTLNIQCEDHTASFPRVTNPKEITWED